MNLFTFSRIGILCSCYKEKFGIPRQPRLVTEAISELVLSSPYNNLEVLRGIEQFSHLWLIFIFDRIQKSGWKPLVRPPRLGGNQRIGVFASRSMFRPNPVGLSAVELIKVNRTKGKVSLFLRGCDLVDGTPVIDIKPYISYSDCIANGDSGFADGAPKIKFTVNFTEQAITQCKQMSDVLGLQKNSVTVDLKKLIVQILQLDPRPSYHQKITDRVYAMRLYDFDLKWRYESADSLLVLALL
ncbi:MAG: tRNA (N6-threonylcarbamoyladenosine(37)-N6)-methyltransferase TrmO [Cocleimonas sp.]|nr:tRNA (N6-threonylcarbamoyladenosine(37)-N6)-methyltransferase TrmO [Cocleimonas sp.]